MHAHHHQSELAAESQQTYRLSRLADLYSMAIMRSLSFTKHSLQWDGDTSQSVLLKDQSHTASTVTTLSSPNPSVIQGSLILQSLCQVDGAGSGTSRFPIKADFLQAIRHWLFKVQIALRSSCLDTDPSRNWCLGIGAGPDSLVSRLGSKMLTARGGRILEQLDLLFAFHFGLLYKWLILLFRADPCALGMMAIILSFRVTARHMTAAPLLLAPAKLSHLICPRLLPTAQAALRPAFSFLPSLMQILPPEHLLSPHPPSQAHIKSHLPCRSSAATAALWFPFYSQNSSSTLSATTLSSP